MTAKLSEGNMSRETRKLMRVIILLMIAGIVFMTVFTRKDIVSMKPEETYQWLRATQIIFGF